MKNFTRIGWFLLAGFLLTSSYSIGQDISAYLRRSTAGRVPTAKSRLTTAPTPYQKFVSGLRMVPGEMPVCIFSKENMFTRVGAPDGFGQANQNPNARIAAPQTATFVVTYNGFTAEAQKAFQYALDIWSTQISSPVPIRVKASWYALPPGTLGRAFSRFAVFSPEGAQKSSSYYAMALAERIARRAINHPDSADIVAEFASNATWYYGTDALTPAGRTDLVSVVLHEVGHGLGFSSRFGVDVNTNTAGLGGGVPAVYDNFIENARSQQLLDQNIFSTPAKLYTPLVSQNLFFNGTASIKATGAKPKLFAPATYSPGSSISHLDERTYPAGNINSLMTPTIGNAEAIHSPGPMMLGMFQDMEWKTTSVLHTPFQDTETVRPLSFTTTIVSDTLFDAASAKLYFYKGATLPNSLTALQSVPLTRLGTTSTYSYSLPASQATGQFIYYFEAKDAAGRVYTNPGKNTSGGQLVHNFVVGPDNIAPTIIKHVPQPFLFQADTLLITALIADERVNNLDTAYVEVRLNNVARPGVRLVDASNIFGINNARANLVIFPKGLLKAGDQISYRIVARDKAIAKNTTTLPAQGFYTVNVVAPQATVRNTYISSLSSAAAVGSDFVMNSFSVTQPSSFTDGAIHSAHPYNNGSDISDQSDYTVNLLAPIKIKANPDSATIKFDEIALVEPGDGTDYTQSDFYDFVIVEGSKDGGVSWFPFLDGYDCRDQPDWLAAWNSKIVATTALVGNNVADDQLSTTPGTPSLFKKRSFSMLDNGNFKAGDVVLIRFRLFADQLARGWGWAIDNLQIQAPAAPKILATEPTRESQLRVYPNPSVGGLVRVEAELATATTEAALSISGPTGQTLRQQTVSVKNGTTVSESLDLSQLPNGLYFVRLQAGDSVQTRKLMIAK
jgi:Secretion system C-terminal sorting domain